MAQPFNTFGSVYIDGVGMKVNEKFKPLPKVTLPSNFEIGNPTEVLFMEYDFSLEEGVITWSNERRKHIEQQKAQEKLLIEQKRKEQLLMEEKRKEMLLEEKRREEIKKEQEKQEVRDEKGDQSDIPPDNEGELDLALDENKEADTESESKLAQEKVDVNVNNAASSVQIQKELPHKRQSSQQYHNQQLPPSFIQPTLSKEMEQITLGNKQHVFYSVGQDILTPLPAVKPKLSEKNSAGPSSFNPADFENELDPFDNVELKTLDDLKELDKVLQNVQVTNTSQSSVSSSMNAQAQTQVNSSSNSASVQTSVPPVSNYNNALSGFPQTLHYQSAVGPSTQGYNQPSLNNVQYSNINYSNNPNNANTNTRGDATSNVQSVNIHKAFDMVSFKAFNNTPQSHISKGHQPTNIQPWISPSPLSQQQQLPSDSSINKSNLSGENISVNMQVHNIGNEGVSKSNNYDLNSSSSWTNNSPTSQTPAPPNQYQIWHEFLQKNSDNRLPLSSSYQNTDNQGVNNNGISNTNKYNVMPSVYAVGQVNGYVGYLQDQVVKDSGSRSQGHSRSNTPPPTIGMLRSARSTPDLVALVNNSGSETSVLHSRSPPIARRVASPPPSTNFCDTKQKIKSPTLNLSASNNKSSDVDPYRTMSGESKRFVDSLTNMGFRRITVAKAVQRIGIEEKEVLDFLCGITRLKEKGLTEEEAEDILLLPEKDQKKAQDFIMLCRRFQEFGFEEYKVREGLLKCNLDEEKTLDWLTASS